MNYIIEKDEEKKKIGIFAQFLQFVTKYNGSFKCFFFIQIKMFFIEQLSPINLQERFASKLECVFSKSIFTN